MEGDGLVEVGADAVEEFDEELFLGEVLDVGGGGGEVGRGEGGEVGRGHDLGEAGADDAEDGPHALAFLVVALEFLLVVDV